MDHKNPCYLNGNKEQHNSLRRVDKLFLAAMEGKRTGMTNRTRNLICIIILFFLITAGCQLAETTPKNIQVDRGSTETPYPTQTPDETPSFPTDGLSYRELRKTTPPAPVNLQLSTVEGIRLDWEPAPVPEIDHIYSDVVLYYNIYRRASNENDLTLLTTTDKTFYVDKMAQQGVFYYYAVSAVHEGPVEGQRTDEQGYSIP
jgi:hypothetical protein